MTGQNRKLEKQDHFDAVAKGEKKRWMNDVYDQAYLDYLAEECFARIGQFENRQVLFYGCGLNWDTSQRFRLGDACAALLNHL
jgi:hypothetical protein